MSSLFLTPSPRTTRSLKVLCFLPLILVGICVNAEADGTDKCEALRCLDRVRELSQEVDDLKFSLSFTRRECLSNAETTRREMEARIDMAVDKLRIDLEAKMGLTESTYSKINSSTGWPESTNFSQILEATPTSQRQEAMRDLDVAEHRSEEVFDSTCGLTGPEWRSSLSDVAIVLNKTLSDLEVQRNSCSSVMDKMSSLELMVNKSLVNLVDQWTNWAQKMFCKEGWHYFENSCYFFSFTETDWAAGRQECLGMDADYVKVTLSEEFDFIASVITGNSWVGLNDLSEEGNFTWISDGTAEGVRQSSWWHEGQPSNYGGNEHCIHYWFTYDKVLWNDAKCETKMRFICEMSPNVRLQ